MSRWQSGSAVTDTREGRCYDKDFDGAEEAHLVLSPGSVEVERLERKVLDREIDG